MSIYIYIYIYIYNIVCICIYIYIYIYTHNHDIFIVLRAGSYTASCHISEAREVWTKNAKTWCTVQIVCLLTTQTHGANSY